MKVKLIQNRESWAVLIKIGGVWEFVYTGGKTMNKAQAEERYYIEKIKLGDTEDAPNIINISERIRVVSYSDKVSGIQIRKGYLFKKWIPYDLFQFDNRPLDKGNCPAGWWHGKVLPLNISLKAVEVLGLEIKDKELMYVVL